MQNNLRTNRKHKDRLFRFIFHDKEALLSLYNAVNDSDYTDEDQLEIYTMEDFVYMGMKNDLSFLIDMNLNVFEHQSTDNPNLPLRGYIYMSSAFQKYIVKNGYDIHSSGRIPLPVPRYYVFYNGIEKRPDQWDLYLTESMPQAEAEKSSAQFTAHMININAGRNTELMNRCRMLYEYSVLVAEIRKNRKAGMTQNEAVEAAVEYCIQNHILEDILRANRAEVTDMLLTEYDEAFHIANEKKLSREEGRRLEQENTEREKKRADAAEARADKAEARADKTEELLAEEKKRINVLTLKLKQYDNARIAEELEIDIEEVEKILRNTI